MKYILVTGGVISGLGKGVISSSLGALLKGFNLNVTAIKIDPYINIDAGTFSPYEHGKKSILCNRRSHIRLAIEKFDALNQASVISLLIMIINNREI